MAKIVYPIANNKHEHYPEHILNYVDLELAAKSKFIIREGMQLRWQVKCTACGNYFISAGLYPTCNCKESRKHHEFTGTKLQGVWNAMKRRCYAPKTLKYDRYGGRGITVCDEWRNSETGCNAFCTWALANGWQEGLQIDRIDNDGPYAPWNCRFVTRGENMRNTSKTVMVPITDTIVLPLVDAIAKYSVVNRNVVASRIFKGWPILHAVLLPRLEKIRPKTYIAKGLMDPLKGPRV